MLPFVKPYRKVKTTSIPYVFNFRLTSLSDSESNPGECVSLTAELAAHKEKLQRETISQSPSGTATTASRRCASCCRAGSSVSEQLVVGCVNSRIVTRAFMQPGRWCWVNKYSVQHISHLLNGWSTFVQLQCYRKTRAFLLQSSNARVVTAVWRAILSTTYFAQ